MHKYALIFLVNQVIQDVRKITGDPEYIPKDPRELCNRVFTTCYMGTTNSSQGTRNMAKDLANQIGR